MLSRRRAFGALSSANTSWPYADVLYVRTSRSWRIESVGRPKHQLSDARPNIAWATGRGKKATDKLTKVQKKAMLKMSGLEDAFITALEGELGIPSLENIYNKDILKFHMKIQLMDEDRIPKRIYEMQWPTKTRKFSLSNIVKSLSRKWRIPLEKDEIAQTIAAKTNTDPNTINGFQIKKHWKLIVDKHMASYTRKRVRKDRTRDNFHYKQFQPEIKHAKPYTTSKSKGDHLCRYSGKAEPRIMPSLQT